MSIAGKSIVITGGTIGIGHELIRNLLEHGAMNVAILDINDTNGATAKLQAKYPHGQTVVYLKTDVRDRENVWQSFREARNRFGRIDVVIGNAGIGNENQPELTIQVNLLGVINSTQAAIEFMGKPNGGNGGIVVNMSSVCGMDIVGGIEVYTATQFAIIGLTRAYASETYTELGIKFIAACPGFVNTTLLDNLFAEKLKPNTCTKDIVRMQEVMGIQRPEDVGEGFIEILTNPKETVYVIGAGVVMPIHFPNFFRRY